jgi:hypothetical protein
METEIHDTIFKTTLAKTLRDRFGAKDPKTEILKQGVWLLISIELKII